MTTSGAASQWLASFHLPLGHILNPMRITEIGPLIRIQINKHHNTSFSMINQVSMYFSVRLETTRSQLFTVTSHTGIKARCLFKLIPHKACFLSDNLHIVLEHSQSFQSLLHSRRISTATTALNQQAFVFDYITWTC